MPTRINDRLISWASDIDPKTIDQAAKAARLPIVEDHVALMPDAHVGIGATVGSVIPTRGAVIPSAVGVDIGCGMIAAELDVTAGQLPDNLDRLLPRIERAVPAGVGKGHGDISDAADSWLGTNPPPNRLTTEQVVKALTQFGTLGSGNHFFEVCLDERDHVWVVLHSGSRGIGNQLAQAHIRRARQLGKDLELALEDPDLAYFMEGTPEFVTYIADMLWAQEYARGNRDQMMNAALAEVLAFIGTGREVSRTNCFAGDTRVLTRTGVQAIGDMAGGTHELLTTGGRWVKAPIRSFGEQATVTLTLSRSGTRKVIRTTVDHGWFVRTRNGIVKRVTTNDLRPNDQLVVEFPERPATRRIDTESVARGFTFGDGSTHRLNSRAFFCGAKDAAMLPYFTDHPAPSRQGDDVAVIYGLPGEWKRDLPSLDLPASHLYGWLAGYFAADGDVDPTGRPSLNSANRDHLEYVRAACAQVGIGTFGIRTYTRTGYGDQASEIHRLGLMRADLDTDFFLIPEHRRRFEMGRFANERRGWNAVKVEDTGQTEEVFCAVVDGTHTFVLEDNILTSNCHHNFSQREVHGGRELWVTRKGAIKADVGDMGVIPGSMGTRSYIVRGRGNPASWMSCSHGAGRRHSRTAAKKLFTADDLAAAMAGKTWQAGNADALIDEIPSAYKDIDQVMADQADLVDVVHTLHQIVNYKGT